MIISEIVFKLKNCLSIYVNIVSMSSVFWDTDRRVAIIVINVKKLP